jgi:uncharacterized protein YlxP (DUF503 family)
VFVAVGRLELHLPVVQTLKQKRAIIQSVATRLRNDFGIAVAEVEHQDNHQIAVLGLAAVSNESSHAEDILRNALRQVESSRLDAEVLSADIDVVPF